MLSMFALFIFCVCWNDVHDVVYVSVCVYGCFFVVFLLTCFYWFVVIVYGFVFVVVNVFVFVLFCVNVYVFVYVYVCVHVYDSISIYGIV